MGVGVRVEVSVLVGVRVREGVGVGVRVGRGVGVSEGVHVGGGGLVGVNVQVGMGVRVAVGVTDSAAMKVLRRAVIVAWVACRSSRVGVWVGLEVGVEVTSAAIVGVRLGGDVAVGERIRTGVIVPVGTDVRERICLTTGSPNSTDATAKDASARPITSSCQPASMRARRVR